MNQPVRTLRRLPQEQKVAGVCAGLARYAGVDPVLVRLGFVLLTVLGGSGLLLYIVAWVIMPKADPNQPLPPASPASRSTILGLIGLAIGAAVVFGDWSFGPGNGLLPLLLIGGGVFLLLQREDATGAARPPVDMPYGMGSSTFDGVAVGDAAADATIPGHPIPDGTIPDGTVAAGTGAASPFAAAGATAEVPAWASDWYRAQTEARAELGLPPLPPPGQEPLAAPTGPAPARPRRRWRAVVVVFTVGVIVLFGALAAGFGAIISGGAGERTYRPTEWGAVRPGYELGVGELVLDLTALPPLTEDRAVSADLGMGKVQVILPAHLDVELEAHAGMGEIVPPAGANESQDGIDVTLTTRDEGDATAASSDPAPSDSSGGSEGDDDGPVLRLDAEVGMGQVEVIRR